MPLGDVPSSPWCLDEYFDEGEGAAGAFGGELRRQGGGEVVPPGDGRMEGDVEGQVRAVAGLDQREAFLAESGSTRT
jgi:hypothetical protein